MKTLRVTVQLCLLLCLLSTFASVASASPLTLTGSMHFSSLDGSAQDSDELTNGVFTVADDLVLDGTVHCNDDLPLPQSAGACPIRISVAGDLTLEAGSAIFAENRRGSGNGGDIRLDVGGALILRGPDSSLPGAIVSTSRPIGTAGVAGNLNAVAAGTVDLEAGSVLAANAQTGSAGAIAVTGEMVRVAGLVASGPSRTVLSTALSGKALDGGSVGQTGGTIHLSALGSSEPGLRIEADALVVSQGEGSGGRLVLLEACGIEVRGLVASLSRNNGPSQVVLRSGKGILVDGRDLGSPAPAEGRFGRIRADSTQQGAAGYLVDLFAESDIQVLGPDPGTGQGLFAVSSTPGDQPLRNAGGTITAISLSGALTGTGNAFETGRDVQGDKGGAIDLQARNDVTLDGATVRAVGGFTSSLSTNVRAGGHIDIRSFQGAVSWTFGVGDVRPTGTGVAAARRGTIEITACTTVDTTGSQFPVNGSAVLPFPVEAEGVCAPAAPSLPEGEPPLPVCAPANQPPAPSGGPFALEENSTNGTVVGTVLANDPDLGQTHMFEIRSGNTDNAFAIHPTTGEITVNNSAALDFEITPSFSLVIRATDNGVPAQFGDGIVVVELTSRNEAPTDLALDGTLTINENAPAGTLVGNLSTIDPDVSDSHSYTLVSGVGDTHNGSFQISGNQLLVLLPPNYEANQALSVRVQTTDAGGLFHSESFTIMVIDLNEPPTPMQDTYTAFGNTQLVAGGLAGTHRAFSTDPDQVDTNDTDPDTLNPAFRNLSVIAGSGTTSKGGSYSIDTDGRFTYQPPVGFVTTTANPGDPTGPDTFLYSVTDGTNITPGGVVQITVNHRIWYVHNDPGTAGDAGDSADPVDTLLEAETKSSAGDYIYVFEGDGTNDGMDAGITLKDGQKLLGERLDLVVGGTTLVDGNGTKRPEISDSNDTVSVLANTANGNRTGIEIRGVQLSSTGGSAIDLTSADAANLEATIHDVVITGTGALQEGIDVNAGSTGTATLAIHNNILAALGTAIDVQRTAGTAYITDFANNAVSGNTTGTGVNVLGAIFDAAPGGAIDPVNGGVVVIGAAGNGVGQAGLALTSVQGSLSFSDLDIFADGGAGLSVSGTGSGMTFGVLPGVGTIEATGGPAVEIAQSSIALPLLSIKSTNSPSTGLALNGVTGSFSAEVGSSISNITSPSGTAFQVGSSNAAITYKGTISTTQGKGVELTSNTGSTIALAGTLNLSTGTNTAFNATGGGTVTATDTSSTLITTTATALNVTGTTIGAGGVKFRSISSDGGGSSGIVLNNTGNSGGLAVGGNGGTCTSAASCTGGAIQNKTVDGISLNNTRGVSLTRMFIDNNDGSGIFGDDVTDFSLINSVVTNNADTASGAEAGLRFNELLGNCAITNTTISGSSEDEIRITPTSGVLTNLAISGSTIGPNNSTTGGNGITFSPAASAQANLTVTGGVFQNIRSSALLVNGDGTTRRNITVSGTTFRDNNSGVHVLGSFNADLTFELTGNTFLRHALNPIQVVIGSTSTNAMQVIGEIDGNVIGDGTPNSGATDLHGIAVEVNGDADAILSITNNSVSNTDIDGIFVQARLDNDADAETGRLDLTLRDNDVNTPDDNSAFPFGAAYGTRIESRNTTTICLDIAGNSSASVGGLEHFRTRQRDTSTFIMERLTDGDGTPGELITNLSTVEAFLAGQNDGGSTADATQQAVATGYTEAANGFCRKPPV
jgi:hypothetical protein